MTKRYLVLRRRERYERKEQGAVDIFFTGLGDGYDTLEEAKAAAAFAAGTNQNDYYVALVVGKTVPVYDPEIGWEPADNVQPIGMDEVWEHHPTKGKLVQHRMNTATNITVCGKQGWPPPYDPNQDVWFGEHDLPADQVEQCKECYGKSGTD